MAARVPDRGKTHTAERHRARKGWGGWFAVGMVVALVAMQPRIDARAEPADAASILARMREAYLGVQDYRTRLTISGFGDAGRFGGTTRLLYTFRKPRSIRIDFDFPHQGMLILYPDEDGKVMVRPSPLLPFLVFHLEPRSAYLEISPGQFIPDTDLGMLIRNIGLCLTDLSRGELRVTETGNSVSIRVLSDNPFKSGVLTRYVYTVNRDLWLPVGVEEWAPEGRLRRRVVYEDLVINTGIPDAVFRRD